MLIPKKAGKVLHALIPDKEPPLMAIGLNDSLAGFQIGEYLLTSRQLTGDYPQYNRIIPTITTPRLTIQKGALEESIRRVSVIGTKDTTPMELSIADNHLTLHANNRDLGEATETLDTLTDSQPFKAGFNAQYLLDALESMPGEQCQLFMESPHTPCLLTTPEQPAQFQHVIMPITLAA
jgi:DNA polymerase-3 subunit beta